MVTDRPPTVTLDGQSPTLLEVWHEATGAHRARQQESRSGRLGDLQSGDARPLLGAWGITIPPASFRSSAHVYGARPVPLRVAPLGLTSPNRLDLHVSVLNPSSFGAAPLPCFPSPNPSPKISVRVIVL